MNHHGAMQAITFHCYYMEPTIGWAVVSTNSDNVVMGWALIWSPKVYDKVPEYDNDRRCPETPERSEQRLQAIVAPLRQRRGCEVHVYVRKPYRRQKIGKRLVDKCKEIADHYLELPMYVCPHDNRSRKFFTELNIKMKHWI